MTLAPTLADFQPPGIPAGGHDGLFAEEPRLVVQTTAERHETKKRSGSSDGAQTYDTPIT